MSITVNTLIKEQDNNNNNKNNKLLYCIMYLIVFLDHMWCMCLYMQDIYLDRWEWQTNCVSRWWYVTVEICNEMVLILLYGIINFFI
jgi:hypothetical protein